MQVLNLYGMAGVMLTLAFLVCSTSAASGSNVSSLPFERLVSKEFSSKVRKIASELETKPEFLMAVMAIETSKVVEGKVIYTFDPAIKNPGSSAVGLIQFMSATAEGLGTSTDKLAKMSAIDQLDYVKKYLTPYKGRMKTVEDVYFAVFYPAAIGKPDTYEFPQRIYGPNKGLDKDKNGKLTRGEIAIFVKRKLKVGMSKAYQSQ